MGEGSNNARVIDPGDDFRDVAVGDRMADGTIYAGVSPDTNKPIYATPKDAPLTYAFDQASEYAAQLEANGRRDWRVPTEGELSVIQDNRNKGALKGTFLAGRHWTSTECDYFNAWSRELSDGDQGPSSKHSRFAVRCVRG